MSTELLVLNCLIASDTKDFKTVKSVLPDEMKDMLSKQGRLLIIAESADSVAASAARARKGAKKR